MEILEVPKARFRIIIRDLKTNKTKTISLKDGNASLEDIDKKLRDYFKKKR